MLKTAQDHGVALRIVETVAAVNEQRKRAMARKVVAALDGSVRGKTIAVLGLTFKPNTDDTRDSPAIPLITALQDLGATVRAYDPAGMEQAKPLLPDVIYCDSAYERGRGRRCRRDRHRMGAVPRARSRTAARASWRGR